MRSKLTIVAIVVTLLVFGLYQPVNAQGLSFNLLQQTLTGNPGDVVTFQGTVTNNTGTAFNATDLAFNFDSYDPTIITPQQLLGMPDMTINDGMTSPTFDLFSVALDPMAVPGQMYPMEASLQDANGDLSAEIPVTIQIANSSPAAVPEPSSLPLVLLGLGVLAIVFQIRSRSRLFA